MALNFTPLKGYINAQFDNEAQIENVGKIAGGIKNLVAGKMYDNRLQTFMDEMGKGTSDKLNKEIEENNKRIADIDAEIAALEAE